MNIKQINFNTFPSLYNRAEKINSNQTKNIDLKSLYPQNYNNYLSFRAKTPPSKDVFPSEKLYNIYKEKAEFDKATKLSDVHKEYYSTLLKCKDINDVRIRYPEFSNVKVGSYLKDTQQKYLIRRLCNNSKGEKTLMNFSLKLLQDYYAKTISISDIAHEYGTSTSKITELMEALNIPIMEKAYLNKLYLSRKNSQEDIIINSLPAWQQRMIAKSESELNAPNKVKREQMLATINKSNNYQKKLNNSAFVSILMPILFENYNNPKFREEGFSIITDKLADKWQDEKYVDFVRKEPIEQWEKDLVSKLSENLSDDDKKKMKVYVNSAILAWKKQPLLNNKIYKEINLRPNLKQVVDKTINGETITLEDENVLKDFYKFCSIKLPRFSQILFQQQKEILNDWAKKVG